MKIKKILTHQDRPSVQKQHNSLPETENPNINLTQITMKGSCVCTRVRASKE
jgi:hypothetical protein